MVVLERAVRPNELFVHDLQRFLVIEKSRSLVLKGVELRVGAGK